MTIVAYKAKSDLEVDDLGEEFRSFILPGEYEAQCITSKEFRQYGGIKKLALTWELTLSGTNEVRIPQFFNMDHKVFKENSFYYEAWVIANNCRRPQRRTRAHMSPKIFLGIIGKVIVVTVKPKFENGDLKPEVFHYSKVQRLLSLSSNRGMK